MELICATAQSPLLMCRPGLASSRQSIAAGLVHSQGDRTDTDVVMVTKPVAFSGLTYAGIVVQIILGNLDVMAARIPKGE